MIEIQAKVESSNTTVPIKVGAGEFKLILRPVSDEERLMDQGMMDRYWTAKDPLEAGAFHAARYIALLNLIIGWEGVVCQTETGSVEVPFSREALKRLLAVKGVGPAVADALTEFSNNGGAGHREKGESGGLPAPSLPDDTKAKLPGSSHSTPGGSEPDNLQSESTGLTPT